ncbi:hypothetical protein [Clostridium sp. BSD9I1]|uniref:hypothetical protein n=1 Tax=Clostridium sp. BSD9I1 TaxID=2003589 RepID=UPI0016494839|nr:hypothetical protein [Clostridium sp. BSD9I1]
MNINKDNEKNMSIYFYDIRYKIYDVMECEYKHTLSECFKYAFKEKSVSYKDKIIDIYDIDDFFVFGSVGKYESEIKLALTRQRNPETLEKKDYMPENSNNKIESFTYFYIDFFQNIVVVLKNDAAPSINSSLSKYILSKCVFIESFAIYQKPIDNITDELNRYTELLGISFAYIGNDIQSRIPSYRELNSISNDNLKKITVNLELENRIADKEFIEKITESELEGFCYYKISGKTTDSELIEALDVVKKVLIKRVPVKLTLNDIKTQQVIKDILKKELFNYINRSKK